MDKREEAHAKDSIIKYMLDNPEVRSKHAMLPKMFSPSDFRIPVFDKKLESQYIERLVKEIINHPEEIVKNVNNLSIMSNSVTQRFIDDGGFLKFYDDIIAANTRQLADVELERSNKELQTENLKLTTELNRQRLKTHYVPIVISITSFLVALGSFAWSVYKPSNNALKKQMNTRIESLEGEVKQLQNDLKQENKKLKDELYKAELMVRVLERESE